MLQSVPTCAWLNVQPRMLWRAGLALSVAIVPSSSAHGIVPVDANVISALVIKTKIGRITFTGSFTVDASGTIICPYYWNHTQC